MVIIPAFIVSLLYSITTVKASGVSLTANVSAGLVCPEGLMLSCVTVNVPITTLRWFTDEAVELDYLRYIFDMSDEYPLKILPNRTSISLVINSAMLVGANVNFNATLTANAETLYNAGFQSISCGSSNEMDRFNISDLDIEVPSRPSFVKVDLIHNSISSLLQQLTIQYRRMIYTRDSCQYRQSSYFNTSVVLDGNILQTVITDINDSNCSESSCAVTIVNFSTPFRGDEDFNILVIAGNIYNESEVATLTTSIYLSIASYFNFSLSVSNCITTAECVLLRSLNITNCTIRYGTDSSYTNLDSRSTALNQSLDLTELLYDTTYYLEAIFTLSGEVPEEVYHLRRNFSTGANTCTTTMSRNVTVIVVPIVVLLIVFLLVIVLVVGIVVFIRKKKQSVDVNSEIGAESETETKLQDYSTVNNTDEEHRMPGEDVNVAIERKAIEEHNKANQYEAIPE